MNQDNKSYQVDMSNDIILLEGMFFVRPKAIAKNTELAQEALRDVMTGISYN